MRCPKCGHEDYNGRCCQECGYPEHQLRSGGSFVPPPQYQRAPARGRRLPGRAPRRAPAGSGPEMGGSKSTLVVVIIVVGILLAVGGVITAIGSFLNSLSNDWASDPLPESVYQDTLWDEDAIQWDEDAGQWEEDAWVVDSQLLEEAADQMEQAILRRYGSGSLQIDRMCTDFEAVVGIGDSHFVAQAMLAAEGDPDALSQWEELSADLCQVGADGHRLLAEQGAEEGDADIYLFDPESGNVYFYQSNGDVYYDYVTDGEW